MNTTTPDPGDPIRFEAAPARRFTFQQVVLYVAAYGFWAFCAWLMWLVIADSGRWPSPTAYDPRAWYRLQADPQELGILGTLLNAATLGSILPYNDDGPRATYKVHKVTDVLLFPGNPEEVIGSFDKGFCLQALDKPDALKPRVNGQIWEEILMLHPLRRDGRIRGFVARDALIPAMMMTAQGGKAVYDPSNVLCGPSAFIYGPAFRKA